MFLEVKRVSVPVFVFSTPELILGGIEGARFSFHVLRSRVVFGVTEGAGSSFHVLRSQTRFRRY
jgi:hypothetical protein